MKQTTLQCGSVAAYNRIILPYFCLVSWVLYFLTDIMGGAYNTTLLYREAYTPKRLDENVNCALRLSLPYILTYTFRQFRWIPYCLFLAGPCIRCGIFKCVSNIADGLYFIPNKEICLCSKKLSICDTSCC